MPEYDAFGREIGEDTLAGLGGTSGSQGAEQASFGVAEPEAPAPPPEPPRPAERPAQPEPQAQPQQFQSFQLPPTGAPVVQVRRRSSLGCLVGLLILIGAVALPVFALVGFVGDAEDTIDGITDVFDAAPEPVVPEPPGGPVKMPSGLGGDSLVAPGNFATALGRLKKAGMGRIEFIRLAPDRLDAQMIKRSRERSAQVDFQGELTRGTTTQSAKLETIAFSAIDRAAPARLVRGSVARFHVREKGINYLVLSAAPFGGHRWIAYFKNGTYVEGDRHGRVVRRIS